jgi:transcriptional regulator with XRE-family HTH domain
VEELRLKLKKHKEKYGSTLKFIGDKIGVSRCTLSLFVNGKRELPKAVAKKLEFYLNSIN